MKWRCAPERRPIVAKFSLNTATDIHDPLMYVVPFTNWKPGLREIKLASLSFCAIMEKLTPLVPWIEVVKASFIPFENGPMLCIEIVFSERPGFFGKFCAIRRMFPVTTSTPDDIAEKMRNVVKDIIVEERDLAEKKAISVQCVIDAL